jgi:hypothetical protein
MACQWIQWLFAGEGPSTLQHGLVGIGCLLTFDAWNRWRSTNREFRISNEGAATVKQIRPTSVRDEQRRAA